MPHSTLLKPVTAIMFIFCLSAQSAFAYSSLRLDTEPFSDDWERDRQIDDLQDQLDQINLQQKTNRSSLPNIGEFNCPMPSTLSPEYYDAITEIDEAIQFIRQKTLSTDIYDEVKDLPFSMQQTAIAARMAVYTDQLNQLAELRNQYVCAAGNEQNRPTCKKGFVLDANNQCFEGTQFGDVICRPNSTPAEDRKSCICDLGFKTDFRGYCVGSLIFPPDVTAGMWYSTALSTFIDAGYIPIQQSFRPAELATREEFIRLIVELNGGVLQELPSKPSFNDVPVDSTAFSWFEEAAKEGWVTGQGDCYGKHPCNAKPNDPINRAEAAALIIRAFGLTQGQAPAFEDAPAGAWYADIIRTAASRCILQGDNGSSRVRPAAHMNRAEMIAMLWRVDRDLSYPDCGL